MTTMMTQLTDFDGKEWSGWVRNASKHALQTEKNIKVVLPAVLKVFYRLARNLMVFIIVDRTSEITA